MTSIVERSAASLVAGLRDGELTAVEVAEASLERIAEREASVRAFAYLNAEAALAAAARVDAERARGESLGPLHGLPIAIKDIIDTVDMPTAWGVGRLADRRPKRDATLVERLRAAGAIAFGKAATSQFALFVPGPTRNPYDLDRTPGGSSSGSAAAVAAGFVPLALGTQTNGSTIRPASYCGVVGFKPSLGVLPRTGILRHCGLIDHPGVFARSVGDAALLVEALAGEDAEDSFSRPPLGSFSTAAGSQAPPRLAWTPDPFADRAESTTRAALDAFIAALPVAVDKLALGAEFAESEALMRDLMCAGVAESLGREIDRERNEAPDVLLGILDHGRSLSAVQALRAGTRRDVLRASIAQQFAPYDAVLTFAAAGEAPRRAEGTGDPIFATLWSLVGAPAFSLPLLSGPSGLPIGVQAVGAPYRDLALTRAAAWLERLDSLPGARSACAS